VGSKRNLVRATALAAALLAVALVAPGGALAGASFGSRALKMGMRGHDVSVLQKFLTKLELPTARDGAFGKGTRHNVKRLEKRQAWKRNGVVSRKDAKKIKRLVAKEPRASTPPSSCSPTGGGVSPDGGDSGCTGNPYVNPIKGQAWLAGRTDMGVDYTLTEKKAVRAIGDAKILGADYHSGWPGGHFLWYKIRDGDHQGTIIYVAETLGKMAAPGTIVAAGAWIAWAKPGGTGTEWGFATKAGQPRAAPCYKEGMKTNSGKEMARFLKSLGAPVLDDPGPGPDYPSGNLC
jgi:hypothetical protein